MCLVIMSFKKQQIIVTLSDSLEQVVMKYFFRHCLETSHLAVEVSFSAIFLYYYSDVIVTLKNSLTC